MMKSVRDYLNLDETERRFFQAWDALTPDLVPLFEKMLTGNSAEFDEAEAELRAILEKRRQ